MARREASDVARLIVDRVIAPLVLGRVVRPGRPLGLERSLAGADAWSRIASDTMDVEIARVRRARMLCPVDTLPPISRHEWLLAAVLHDMLLAANDDVRRWYAPRRDELVLAGAEAILGAVPAPATVGDALARHATFATVLAVTRFDLRVSWWCGSEVFRGRTPPRHLLSWATVRRVHAVREGRPLVSMSDRTEPFARRYQVMVGRLLGATPLTDLVSADRQAPRFAWRSSALALLATHPGRVLAGRALRLAANDRTAQVACQAPFEPLDGATKQMSQVIAALGDELEAYRIEARSSFLGQ